MQSDKKEKKIHNRNPKRRYKSSHLLPKFHHPPISPPVTGKQRQYVSSCSRHKNIKTRTTKKPNIAKPKYPTPHTTATIMY
jgi:hypothetical protein